ncbi:MAG: SnoaL-like domain-containing protein [Hamadaea sp.]|uniref:nuclear transport factor 2 family protein n=1 Tax=Hamadaea sp. TaxID=2024425 RepID=UPI00185460ED|nr:nuclear transport factor 2 family protein [Hamadaea sp.]NUR73388.1 SnoaL-like domain-containing protein [Hamadaea sp.]NUT18535.1 SnoaL-like domain-containing protein [Hamadaea sp.]
MTHSNKDLVLNGFAEFAAGNIDILHTLLHEDFVEHSPGNPSGRDAFVAYMKTAPVAGAKLDLKRVIAENDLVVLHYRMSTPTEELAVVDIWRLADGKIVEHWDVVQPVPPESETPYGMF